MEYPSAHPQEAPDRSQANEAEHAAVIDRLLEIARAKGTGEAILEAQKLNNPHILDELHDRLSESTRQQNAPGV